MKLLAVLFALLFANAAWNPARADCPLDLGRGTGLVIFSDHYMIAFRPDPLRIEVGEPFALVFNVCTKSGSAGELVVVDAVMPEHKHTMNYRPSIVSKGDGRFRAEGLVFHMAGHWEISIDVRAGEEIERLTHDYYIK
ncbi:MAG: FixH family protein [Reyranella sp.]|nr:FixH family protein [Reyranella sp.]